VAAGPLGRTAEAGGVIGGLAPIYSYSKCKGFFAGISVEGAVIVERKDANAEFYKRRISCKEILSGNIPKPPEANGLYKELSARIEEAKKSASGASPSTVTVANVESTDF
jgi:lipid-binding SYLF domain-containing protein